MYLLIYSLSMLIVEKLEFHRMYQMYNTHYQYTEKTMLNYEDNYEQFIDTVSRLLSLSSLAISCENRCFQDDDFSEIPLSCLIDETYGLYVILTTLIKQVNDYEEIEEFLEQYEEYYKNIRIFYKKLNGIPLLKMIKTVKFGLM